MASIVGTVRRLQATFKDPDAILFDPEEVTLSIKSPNGTRRQLIVGNGDSDIQRVVAGVYRAFITLDAPGTWYYIWTSGGEYPVVAQASIVVKAKLF